MLAAAGEVHVRLTLCPTDPHVAALVELHRDLVVPVTAGDGVSGAREPVALVARH